MLQFRIAIFLFFISFFTLNAQNNSDIGLIYKHIKSVDSCSNTKNKTVLQKSNNPGKEILYLLLFFYQKIISEQISAGCGFELSCSNFGFRSIKELGIVKGIYLTADRLTRCNGQAQLETESYLINHANGKVIDEPSMYHFKN